jgi:uncharacterized cupredoxin-like copper-binding protein
MKEDETRMTGPRVAALSTVLVAALVWTLPALGRDSSAAGTTTDSVTIGKPTEFHFTLSKQAVKKGTVVFTIVNKGTLPHDFKIAGKKTKLLQPGSKATLKVVFRKAGKYPYLCTVSGHAAAGMKGVLKVS